MVGTIASTFKDRLHNSISESTPTNHHICLQRYNSNCTSQTDCFHLAVTFSPLFVFASLNAFQCINGLLKIRIDYLTMDTDFCEQSDVPSRWNLCWMYAAEYREGLKLRIQYSDIFGLSIGEPMLG